MSLNLALRREFTWNFIVAEVPTAILGADFLAHTGLLVDLKGHRLLDPLTSLSTQGDVVKADIHSVSLVQLLNEPPHVRSGYDELLTAFEDITVPSQKPVTLNNVPVAHHIVTEGPPVFERPRRLCGDKLEAAKIEFRKLLDRGIIQPSSSPWASPLHLVQKKNGGWRATGDYRRLNARTLPDRYPLPLVEDLLQSCHGNTIFSIVDLERAYYQIPMATEDVGKTAVTTPFGLFEFKGMPLGLRNSAQTFQRFVDSLLRDLPFIRCYLDDMLVVSHSHEEHICHLRQLFEALRRAGLSINITKCDIGKSEVQFLGYKICKFGFEPPAHKVDAITSFPKPKTIADLRRFLGMLNFYRRCIPRAAFIQAPLNEFLKGVTKRSKAEIHWNPAADEAFQACKDSMAAAVRPAFLSHVAQLSLTTDASNTAIGAALEQLEDGVYKPIGFFSRKLSDTETRYSTYDRELLAVFAAIKFFQRILEGRAFKVRTDHRPIIFAARQRSDKASPRQQRQLDYILQFNVTLEYLKGENNVVADALSRICTIDMPLLFDAGTIAEAQTLDSELPHLYNKSAVQLQDLAIDSFTLTCDVSTGCVRPYIPATLRRQAFDLVHNLSHPSGRATARQLSQKYFWPGVRKDAHEWCRQCQPCQRAKVHRYNRAAFDKFDVPENRFDHVHLDLITLPQADDFKYCLTVLDRFSRWPVAVPLKNIQTETVASAFFDNWICNYGTPLTLTTDQGAQFESNLFSSLAQLIGAKRIRTTPYHPQSNGLIERFHRTLKTALMCNDSTPWTRRLPAVLLGLRASFKEDLQASSAEMVFGRTLRLPGEFFTAENGQADPHVFLDKFRQLIRQIKPVSTSNHAKQRPFIFKDLKNCTHVYKKVESIRRPLEPPFSGPHEVVKRINDKNYVIKINGVEKAVSTDSLKPAYFERSNTENLQERENLYTTNTPASKVPKKKVSFRPF